MKTVLTYGTFDLFHYGHYNLLRRAKNLGDRLIVGVSSDELCREKGKVSFLSEGKRMEIVSSLRFVDEVILETSMAQKVGDAEKYHVDIFCLGSDYRDVFPRMAEYRKLLDLGCEVVFLERTPDVSTTELKRKMTMQSALEDKKLQNK